jgi:2,3-bisphosphoglycerate-dependent phosphoglycerate mutase
MEVTRLYLIRHGQSAGNAEGRFGGHSATPLSELGLRQADLTAQLLVKEKIAAIYSSDLLRAIQTAEPLAKLLEQEIITTSEFRERHVGVLEGLTFDEAKNQYPSDYYALVNRKIGHVITNGESYRQLLNRTNKALRKILREYRGQKVVIFSHTGAICFMTLQLLGAIHRKTYNPPWLVTSNCGINRFEFRGRNNIRLLSVNDTRHLHQITGDDAFAVR